MRRAHLSKIRRRGTTLAELLMAISSGMLVIGGMIIGAIAVRKAISATDRYITSTNNQTRVMDYVGADLRRALRVATLTGGVSTPLKSNSTGFGVTETNILTINIPDIYASNTPDNTAGSTYKTSRYARGTLDTSATYWVGAGSLMNGVVPWAEATRGSGTSATARYAPTGVGTGEIQVRYYRAKRSLSDPALCYFRAEYPDGSNTPNNTVEVAERVVDALSTTTLLVFATTPSSGRTVFTIQSTFNSAFSRANLSVGTREAVGVSSRNTRRD